MLRVSWSKAKRQENKIRFMIEQIESDNLSASLQFLPLLLLPVRLCSVPTWQQKVTFSEQRCHFPHFCYSQCVSAVGQLATARSWVSLAFLLHGNKIISKLNSPHRRHFSSVTSHSKTCSKAPSHQIGSASALIGYHPSDRQIWVRVRFLFFGACRRVLA
jgi:hypothetical protein